MPDIAGTTRAQTNFLRALRDNPDLPAEHWPSHFMFRKWLRRPAFRRALASLRDASRFRSALHLSRSGADAASILESYLHNRKGYDLMPEQISFLQTLLRLSQSADRLNPTPKPRSANPLIADADTARSLALAHARSLADANPVAPQPPPSA